MALRKFGKIYHILYRDLSGKIRTVTTGESDKKEALKKETAWMSTLKAERMKRKRGLHFTVPGAVPLSDEVLRAMEGNSKRVKLTDALDVFLEKYTEELPMNTLKNWKRFIKDVGVKYMDEVTPQIAFNYLDRNYRAKAGKTYNNNKNSLNAVFKSLLMEAGMDRSPFDLVKNRKNHGKHQRPFSEEEFLRIYHAAEEPWKTACLITWHTGLRQESVFKLRYDHIENDIITTMPGKTARYNRAVRIPIHPQLKEHIAMLPPSHDGRILGFDKRKPSGGAFSNYFGGLLDRLEITDNEKGLAVYNSIRNSFISRCRAAGIPEHAIRGMVGHVESDMTDLYSHEIESAMPIKKLIPLELRPQSM